MRRSILAFVLLGVWGAALADDSGAAVSVAQGTSAEEASPATDQVCPQDTGSHIQRKPGDCLSTAGRTYGSEELRSTGSINTGDGLRRMDPTITTN
ncbi:hypothetical protein [Nevskia soli]|uniref:hypothetical protein n=1 Tax=Nevskia soli TaxID=418856 RepID=UPI0012FA152C|nr:hypothetical protein [Nevskia soli]